MYQLTEMQQKVFNDRYALKDSNGNQLENNIEDTWHRIAKSISSIEIDKKYWENEFYNILYDFKFIPGGRIINSAGSEANQSSSFYNCFVLNLPDDSRQGIMKNITDMVEIMSRGGGVGVNLSSLRPRGAYVKGVNGYSSGVISWGELYSQATGSVCQGGSRRGALMLSLQVDHPDIAEFIIAKQDLNKLTNANLSVLITDDFINAVKNNLSWNLKFNDKIFKTIQAEELWNLICECAWRTGEPGVIFIDQYNLKSNTWYYEKIIGCNPCAEQGLPEGGCCNLGSINLSGCVEDNITNYDKLLQIIKSAIRFLDNIIDVTPYFFEENSKAQKNTRRIGLGNMGIADVLIKLKLRYGSKESLEYCDKLYKFIAIEAYKTSIDLAQEKGSFLKFNFEDFFINNKNSFAYQMYNLLSDEYKEKAKKYGIRNAAILTQAPTGSTGLLANTSSGIEPNFAFEIKRKDRLGEHIVKHKLYEKWLNENKNQSKPDYFITAQEISVEDHILMQSTIQKWVDSSCSKTINASNNDTVENVKKAYLLAYDQGCKGITYFRDGSRDDQVLTSLDKNKEEIGQSKQKKLSRGYIVPALHEAKGYRVRLTSGCGNIWLMCFANKNNDIIELFINTGSRGGCSISTQAMSRLVSLALRGGISLEDIVDQLESAGSCPSYQYERGKGKKVSAGQSCPSAIAKALIKLQNKLKKGELTEEIKEIKIDVEQEQNNFEKCPECGGKIVSVEGCKTCFNCGYSKCS